MNSDSASREREQRFRALHDAAYGDLLRFVSRRAPQPGVDDVVSEVMLVAWRRLDDIPPDISSARGWLFGVARNTLLNTGRRELKHEALPVRLAEVGPLVVDGDLSADAVAVRTDVARAWRTLSDLHQETLALAVLDELSSPEAAAVLGISPTAFRLRLSRARGALRRAVESGRSDRPPLPTNTPSSRRSA